MREINSIIIHCSATQEGRPYHVADIRRWHKARGFVDVGYHFIVTLDGEVETGRPLTLVGAHCTNHNAHSIGICYIGGLDTHCKPKDTRTEAQKKSLKMLIDELRTKYHITEICGHRKYANKACPCFDVESEYRI